MQKVKLQILSELINSSKSFWDLLADNNFLLKDFIDALTSLHNDGLITFDGSSFKLTEKGRKTINEKLGLFKSEICKSCLGKRVMFNGEFKEVFEEFKKIVKNRPDPTINFFQGYMKEYDVVARVAFMHLNNDLYNKSFVLIGDDDLLSIALSLTGLPSRICVLDVDERLGEYLKKINQKYNFEIEFYKYDVSEPLPENLINQFDVFSSEPLESESGLKAFIERGIYCLKNGGAGYFGLTTAEASFQKWLKIEKFLTKMNCVITDIIKSFSRYPMNYTTVNYEEFVRKLQFPIKPNPGVEWYKSTLFRFEILKKPKKIINRKLRIEYVDFKEDFTYPSF
ncbi:MAG: bis-aminopropyl spermidine synthase family protein [Candidatus Bathyarchaeia archaeon]|nr:bis-aminopropyl spermidine synthase family protein [Candidatus Bathyarchaeota archaeon]